MFTIFLTCIFSTLIVASILFAIFFRQLFPEVSKRHMCLKIFLFNVFLLLLLFFSKFIRNETAVWSAFQQLIIIIFVSELFFTAAMLLFNGVSRLYAAFISKPVNKSRRNFLMKSALIPVEGIVLYGSFIEKNHIILNKYNIPIAAAGTWKGLKIAHLTDVHMGSYFSLAKLKTTMERLVVLEPDILAVTGDIFDDDNTNEKSIALIGQYCNRFKYGIYYCWGNHEYMRNMAVIRNSLAKTDVHVLENQNIIIENGNDKLTLIGVDYPRDRTNFAQLGAEYMEKALVGVPQDSLKILLAHHSDFIDNAFANNINLALTGHTHGGQFGLFGYPLFPGFKYVRGMFTNNGSYGYVSTGAGSWFPFRLGCPPEITLFTIV